jgi:hypothetical protein
MRSGDLAYAALLAILQLAAKTKKHAEDWAVSVVF